MCFSMEASFGAAIVLGGIGILTSKSCSSKSLRLLSLTPFLFSIQQFAEGILWLDQTSSGPNFLSAPAMQLFLIFAFLVWPIWIPLSLFLAESNKKRRLFIGLDLLAGVSLSIANLFYALTQVINVRIENHSIQYLGEIPPQTILYPLIVFLPCFISSLKNMWVFGVLIAISFGVAHYFYYVTFISVWCFFSAIASLIIYKIIKDNQIIVKK